MFMYADPSYDTMEPKTIFRFVRWKVKVILPLGQEKNSNRKNARKSTLENRENWFTLSNYIISDF